jgi:UDP-N-acetylglucosamine 2-epimerase (non-hydrolysing)
MSTRRSRVMLVAGARPNFMKVAPIMAALRRRADIEQLLVHTGQHYDRNLSAVFFEELDLPRPDLNLAVGSGSHAAQTAAVMVALERPCLEWQPDVVVVVGDVNSTLAAALVAAKLGIPVAHVEAGLRSCDWSMPEEINRVLTDRLSHLLFTTERAAADNLQREGIPAERIHFVGNVMIDSLLAHRERARALAMPARMGVPPGGYALVTLHRPSNVDSRDGLAPILDALAKLAVRTPVLFPVHPRTRERIGEYGLESRLGSVRLIDPAGYLEFLSLLDSAGVVLTDSGGVQEETTVLGVPCLTLRPNTERPITLTEGTNRLVALDRDSILTAAEEALAPANGRTDRVPELWDGHAGERIARVLAQQIAAGFPATPAGLIQLPRSEPNSGVDLDGVLPIGLRPT